MRSTREVVESHLALSLDGALEQDLAENYSDDVVLLAWGEGVHRGKDGARMLADVLRQHLPDGAYRYESLHVADEYALLRWTGASDGTRVDDGADSFVVRDGLVVAQTISFSVTRPD